MNKHSLKLLTVLKSLLIGLCLITFISFVSCKKDENSNHNVEYGTLSDIDGNVYKTVKIGDHWWMAENLKVQRYRNGDSIKFVGITGDRDSTKWINAQSGAYCIIDNLDSTAQNYKGNMFGLLYNGFVVSDTRNIAPEGWHVPSDNDWKELEIYLGMSQEVADQINWRGSNEGDKLKSCTGWNLSSNKYEIWGNNESGFAATGGGCCMFSGEWGSPGTFSTGFWWSSTSTDENELWYRYLDYNKANVFRYYGPITYGFSVRCVKD
ncbi:MAG: fibrobacter succinogenes major paralogous domain-containing protein [Bacteroidales bacterium]